MINPSLSRRLRERITGGDPPILVAGVANALTARIAEELRYECVYVSGAGVANTFLGSPDVGLVTLTEMCSQVAAVRDAVSIPIIVDGDTGYGNAIGVRRTISYMERAGANGIQLEDQAFPKKCGHFLHKEVISQDEMVGKIRAAADARSDDDFIIIARTDACEEFGIEAACARARAYLGEGADVAFVEAPPTRTELLSVPSQVGGATLANMVEGGRTPLMSLSELGAAGYRIVLYANTAMRASIVAMKEVLAALSRDGQSPEQGIASWDERQELVRKPWFDDLLERYSNAGK